MKVEKGEMLVSSRRIQCVHTLVAGCNVSGTTGVHVIRFDALECVVFKRVKPAASLTVRCLTAIPPFLTAPLANSPFFPRTSASR